ncbi:MAG: MBL fold metallo-hydrolase [Bdellovibrionales bacterium]
MSYSSLGTSPDQNSIETFEQSENFDKESGQFVNRRPGLIKEMHKRMFNLKMLKDWLGGQSHRVPKEKLPSVRPNLEEFKKDPERLKLVWFGHSTFLLNVEGKMVLFDPVFSGSASPLPFVVSRFQEPALSLEELPEIDYIVISHDHYDHLDMKSIKFFVNKKAIFITPLGVGSHLQGWGIEANRIEEKDWWDSYVADGIRFIATPAQHFSGRKGVDGNKTLWASWVVQSANHNIYFSGDSGYDEHFKSIGEKLGPFDIAFLENGQYNEMWKEVHLLPEDTLKAFEDLNASRLFPVHWGMFNLSFHSWFDPIDEIYSLTKEKNYKLVSPVMGQVVDVKADIEFDTWWKSLRPVE